MKWTKTLAVIFLVLLLTFSVNIIVLNAVSDDEQMNQANNGKYIPIINFHRFDEVSDRGGINITPDDFEGLLKHLDVMGYTTITNKELEAYLDGKAYLPSKPILLTVDDAYESFYKNAYPLLKEYDMRATVFVITSIVGEERAGEPISSWDQIKEMNDSGLVEIGNHTHRLHFRHAEEAGREALITNLGYNGEPLSDQGRKQLIVEDLQKANTVIRKHVGVEPTSVAYPYGAFDDVAEEAVEEAGMTMAYTTESGVNHMYSDKLSLKRYNGASINGPKWYTDQFAKEEKILGVYEEMRTSLFKHNDTWTAMTFLNGTEYKDSNGFHKETRYELWKDGKFVRNFGASYRNFADDDNIAITTDDGQGLSGHYILKIISVTEDLDKIVHYREIEF